MAVLRPLFAIHPDHPGVVHYIIHACDTPSLAQMASPLRGTTDSRQLGTACGSHAGAHLCAAGNVAGGHRRQSSSVAASQAAEARHESGVLDQFHSDDFLLYAYLQSGRCACQSPR